MGKQYTGLSDSTEFGIGWRRVHEYFGVRYNLQYSRLNNARDADTYVNWRALNDTPFIIWYANEGQDENVKLESQEYVREQVGPNAQIKRYDGGHIAWPLDQIIASMFEGS